MPMLDLPDYEQELMRVMSELLNDLEVDGAPADVAKRISTVLLVEDEVRLAALISSHLRELKLGVRIEHDGESGLAAALEEAFDLIILDVVLPGLDGFAICREVRRRKLTTPIMMLSARGVTEDRVRGLDSGADDYLTKPFGVREFMARVTAVLRRAPGGSKEPERASMGVVTSADVALDPDRRQARVRGELVELTKQEFDILYLLASRRGIVFSRSALIAKVWGGDTYVTERTVDSVVSRLRRKIERDPNDPQMLLTAWGVGYKFADA
jgi:DNA-binding response OmpR family regulator